MSFPRYPAYKDSGVAWLGEVPEHWEVLSLRRIVLEVNSGTSVNAVDEPANPGQAGVLKTSCVYTGEFRSQENKAILDSERDRACCPVKAGSLIVSRMNTPDLVGAAGLVKHDAPDLYLPDRLWQVRFSNSIPLYAHHWTKSFSYRAEVQMACSGTSSSMQNLSQEDFYSFRAPIPPEDEQVSIAHFLDHETAKIDALITEQQRLIELLQEKRQAVISQAVTKGLNPDASMKDSGVEWLGEVPEHWDVMSVKRILVKIEQGWSPDCLATPAEDEEWGVVKAGCVNGGEFDPLQNKKLPSSLEPVEEYEIFAGDLLMSRASGSPDLIGSAAYIDQVRPRLIMSDKIFRLRTSNKVEGRYLAIYLGSLPVRQQIRLAISGAAGLANNLPQQAIKDFLLVLPPHDEQSEIIDFLYKESAEFQELSEHCKSSVKLLQERRSTLISAAVTGQIDVRGFVPEAVAA